MKHVSLPLLHVWSFTFLFLCSATELRHVYIPIIYSPVENKNGAEVSLQFVFVIYQGAIYLVYHSYILVS